MIFDFTAIEARARHKLLTAAVVPRPIAWVSTLSLDGIANIAPFAFFNAFSDDPPTLALGIADSEGHRTDTATNIKATCEFVVNLVPWRLLPEVEVTAKSFAPEVDEFVEARLSKLPSSFVRPPRIAESPVAFECVLSGSVQLGNKRWLALGEIKCMHVADDAVLDAARFHIDTPGLDLAARVEGGGYARLGERVPASAVQNTVLSAVPV